MIIIKCLPVPYRVSSINWRGSSVSNVLRLCLKLDQVHLDSVRRVRYNPWTTSVQKPPRPTSTTHDRFRPVRSKGLSPENFDGMSESSTSRESTKSRVEEPSLEHVLPCQTRYGVSRYQCYYYYVIQTSLGPFRLRCPVG